MSRTEDILDKTKRKEPEAKKWKVVVGIVVGLVLAGGLFVGGMTLLDPIVSAYLETNDRAVSIVSLYDFYDKKVGENEMAVYFIGSSLIQDSIAPAEINSLLKEAGYNVTAYDLGVSGDRTELRTLQINSIIESRPALVIYGISYITLSYEIWISEYSILVSDRINLSKDAYWMYSDDELDEILGNVDSISKNKIFLKSAIMKYLSSTPDELREEANYLSERTWNRITGLNQTFTYSFNRSPTQEQRIQNIESPEYPWRATVSDETNREKEALIYNVQKLEEAGIPVIIINMPINPLLSEKITDESRQNFFDVLNQTGAKWYDLEFLYDEEYFADSHHMWSVYGRDYFSPVMADLIIQEMS